MVPVKSVIVICLFFSPQTKLKGLMPRTGNHLPPLLSSQARVTEWSLEWGQSLAVEEGWRSKHVKRTLFVMFKHFYKKGGVILELEIWFSS